ncbi:unnamed protein product [Heligmosomoides polygyrus]|uniref:DUF1713 domain-containing protein n=1 Tax=Heligmosomoides polygyrus TaxID=6339 RepID=A0A183G033_HELPZ|nr:unnamed protein product [Heligmosomoides polygyrus]
MQHPRLVDAGHRHSPEYRDEPAADINMESEQKMKKKMVEKRMMTKKKIIKKKRRKEQSLQAIQNEKAS